MESLKELYERPFLGHPIGPVVLALALAALSFFALLTFRRFAARGIAKRGEKSQAHALLRLLIDRLSIFFVTAVALGAAGIPVDLGQRAERFLQHFLSVAIIIQGVIWARALIEYFLARSENGAGAQDPSRVTTLRAVSFVTNTILYALAAVLVLDNIGVNVTTLVTGLGVGGIAVALAAQNVLGDLFASMTIVFDKPFILGDAIAVGEFSGKVEYIGLKTTRIRSTSGEQLIFANADLLQSRIKNFGRMNMRRIEFTVSVAYDTARVSVEKTPAMLAEIIKSIPGARLDRAHLASLGRTSLDFVVVYFVDSPDYALYMDIHQRINLEILRRFEESKILLSSPPQTIRVAT